MFRMPENINFILFLKARVKVNLYLQVLRNRVSHQKTKKNVAFWVNVPFHNPLQVGYWHDTRSNPPFDRVI